MSNKQRAQKSSGARGGDRDPPARSATGSHQRLENRSFVAAIISQMVAAIILSGFKIRALLQLSPGVKYVSPFFHIMATIDWAGAVLGLGALVIAWAMPPLRQIDSLVAWLGRNVRVVASGTAIVLSLLSLTVHQGYPLTMDEYAPLFQAEVFAAGRLTSQWPPQVAPLLIAPESNRYFLDVSFVTGQGCSEYWPGHAAMLAAFVWFGIPWALNPLLTAASVILLARLARQAFGPRAAGWAVLFALASPVFVAYGISFYAMPAHCVVNLLFATLLSRPKLTRVAAAGVAGGFALALHNPLPHFAFAVPGLAWLAWRSDRWKTIPLIGLCYAVVFLPIDVGWRHVEQSIKADRVVPIGALASADGGRGPGGDTAAPAAAGGAARDVVEVPAARLSLVSPQRWRETVGHLRGYFSVLKLPTVGQFFEQRGSLLLREVAWDTPGLLVLACLGGWLRRREPLARLLALSALSTFIAYIFVPFNGGHGWGYRYFFQAWGCLPFLASGVAAGRLDPSSEAAEGDGPFANTLRRCGLAAVLSCAICLPVRLWQIHGFVTDHRSNLPPLPAVTEVDVETVVRFLEVRGGWFFHDLIRNDPFLRRGPFTFVSQGFETDREVIAWYGKLVSARPTLESVGPRGSTWVLSPLTNAVDGTTP